MLDKKISTSRVRHLNNSLNDGAISVDTMHHLREGSEELAAEYILYITVVLTQETIFYIYHLNWCYVISHVIQTI